jgi:hypothetical protein
MLPLGCRLIALVVGSLVSIRFKSMFLVVIRRVFASIEVSGVPMSAATADKAVIARELAASLALNRGLIEDFNLTWRDDAGRGLMHHAVMRNDVKLVQDMIIAGVSVLEKDRVGWSVRSTNEYFELVVQRFLSGSG